MDIAIIDADLIGRKKHRFPNLACMKLSSYHKALGDNVVLKTDYSGLIKFHKVYLSCVFTDTKIPDEIENYNIIKGGTGFYYDNAPPLDYEIEHMKPDYDLYTNWIEECIKKGSSLKEFDFYINYSIGFLTRGCFRKCQFCVNQRYDKVELASSLNEFIDEKRKYICLLDDNFLGYKDYKSLLNELQYSNHRFVFKQGLDARLLTKKKCDVLFKSKYINEFLFAFDDYKDKEAIKSKLYLISTYNVRTRWYVLTGFDRQNNYDTEFWYQDLIELFERIKILSSYSALPYIMRHENYQKSPYKGVYITVARWCNQPSFFRTCSLKEFIQKNDEAVKSNCSSSRRYINQLLNDYPIFKQYLSIKFVKK